MNSKDEARHSSLIETKTYVTGKNSVWSANLIFSGDFSTYNLKLDAIELNKQKSIAILLGFTIDKSNKETLLVRDLLFIMPAIQSWANQPANNRPDIKAAATIAESLLPLLEDTILLSKAKAMAQILTDNPTIVDPQFVPAARQTSFLINITKYEDVIQMPETKIDERATHTSLMVDGIKDALKFRKDPFLIDVKLFRESNPDFFLGFKQSMKIDNNPTSKLALKGLISDETTGIFIPNVSILVANLDKTAKSGKKGNYLIKSLPPGQYTVLFTKFGYQPLQKTIFINAGERTDLNIKLIKIV
ncbi:MAG: carboxypeptidase-like regulatory domain-containing protein [Bacteroidia bacterium]